MPPYTTNLEHLHHSLHRLDLLLEQAVQQFRAARTQDKTADFRAVYISDDEIDRLVSTEEATPASTWTDLQAKALQLQETIQQRVEASRAAGITLQFPYLCNVFRECL